MTLHASLAGLLEPAPEVRRDEGYGHTLDEILSQPRLWRETAETVSSRRDEILARFREWGLVPGSRCRLLLTGAGSSVHAAMCAEHALRPVFGSAVEAVATTDLVTGSGGVVGPAEPHLMLSFARSGDSPESLAALAGVGADRPNRLGDIILTCNPDGALARCAGPNALVIAMPEGANDRGLAMTASYSCMTLAAILLAGLEEPTEPRDLVREPASCVERFFGEGVGAIVDCSMRPFERAVFLGSGPLKPTARECALKLMELTAGRVVCLWDSYLGLRHGPQAMVDDRCLVVALIDDAPGSTSLPYELDLLQELRQKGQGQALLTVSNEATPEIASLATATIAWRPAGACLPLALRPITDVVVGQLLGLFASMKLGLKPDRPSPSGIINRVVQGVRIYDPDGLAQGQVREWKPRPASE